MPTDLNNRRRPSGPRRASRAVFLLPLVVVALSGCEQRFGLPDPASKQGEDILSLWLVCLYGATALGVLVIGLLFYSLIRHRRRTDELPKQTEGSVPWELTYTIIPFIVVGLLFGYGLKVQGTQTELSDDPDLRISVTGYQWNWRFEYHDTGATDSAIVATVDGTPTSEPEMLLPVDQRVRFNLVAVDVNHAFFIPQFVTKRDLIPGVRNEIEVTPKTTGEYIGHCAEYCGLKHSQMNFKVRVVSQAEYDDWLAKQAAKSRAAAASSPSSTAHSTADQTRTPTPAPQSQPESHQTQEGKA